MSKQDNAILTKSYSFAIRIVKCYQYILKHHRCYDIARQILKSGTSIGANVEEAQGGQSKKDFIAKIQIAYKESRETVYWLRLLKDTELLPSQLATSLLSDCIELRKILIAILNSAKK